MPESPGESELLLRVRAEGARTRAARRAYERWVTAARLRAAVERRGISGPEAAAFVCDALWPGMPAAHRDALLRAVETGEFELRLPKSVEDAVGEREIELLAEFGFL
jgi:hypothetical protein